MAPPSPATPSPRHTACCAAGVAVQTIIKRDGLIQRVQDKGPKLMQMVREALQGIDAVGDIRGRGYFIGIEFVADRQTKEPFPAEQQLFARIRQTAFDDGLICYPVGRQCRRHQRRHRHHRPAL